MNTSEQDLDKCNFVKAVLMLTVILDHSLAFWSKQGWGYQRPVYESQILGLISNWLGSFHIYGFTLVSGYIFYAMKYEDGKYGDYILFIKNKARRLLLPYSFAAIVWVVPVTALWSRGGILRKYILMESPSQLWFLIMLFGVFILYYPISDFVDRHVICGMIIMIGGYGLGKICNHFLPNIFQLWTAFQYLVFFFLGCMIRKFGIGKLLKIPCTVYILIDIGLFVCYILIIDRDGSFLILQSVLFLLHCTGAVGSFIVIQKLAELSLFINTVEEFGGRYSMTIYLFHQQLIYITLEIGNGQINNYCLAIINFLFAFIGASGIAVLLHKFSMTRYLVTGKH